tara:strand:+ start:1122 stop:1790 length:669 start_codon:yes stop_codon:yes gene_type:complete
MTSSDKRSSKSDLLSFELNKINDISLIANEYGISPSIESDIQSKIYETNRELKNAGKSILQVAKLLSQIKTLVKNNNWVELTDSGCLQMPGRVARDLASAYENWLAKSSIPESALTQVSARTLARIGKVDHSIRVKIEKYLKQDQKFTENDLSGFLRKPHPTKSTFNDLLKQAALSTINMSAEVKLEKFPKLFIENIELKQRIRELERKLFDYKLKLKKHKS